MTDPNTIPINYVVNLETRPLKWKDQEVPFYSIRNDGRLYCKNMICSTYKINGRNYSFVTIDNHSWCYRIDYMVAYTFMKRPEDAIRLIHKNGDLNDDRISNLAWYRKADVMEQYKEYTVIESDGSIREEWKPCNTEYNPNLGYEVSNLGMIRDKDQKIVKLHDSYGYKVFYYLDPEHGNKTRIKSVHRAVAEAFIPNPNHYTMVNHLDGVRSNDIVFNLEWVDNGMNSEHAYLQGLNRKSEVVRSPYTKQQITMVCKMLEEGAPHVTIEAVVGVDRRTISDIYRGRRWLEVSSNFKMPKKKWTPELKQQITNMMISGMKGKEIFTKLNIPYDQSAISLYERFRRELKSEGKIQ